jgi:hypothetical protein
MNFFSWIRDGVRQAVLLGVSDAVGDIGTPTEDDDIGQRLLQALRTGQPALTGSQSDYRAPRKKLGRSLNTLTQEQK